MKLVKRIFLILGLALVILIALVLFKTFTFTSNQITGKAITPIQVRDSATVNFSNALKIKTISPENTADFDSIQFNSFASFLSKTYPLADSLLNKKIFNSYSFLYHWKGNNDNKKPIILMGHLDVVPVIEANLPDWKMDPFGGEIKNDTIWGRGTIDDKIGVIGILEAVEQLLKEGYTPSRDIYLAFGHDEEIGGEQGAIAIASYLKSKGVQAEYVLDEGGTIVQGMIPGITKDAALIGIAEKGFVTLDLSVKIEGGHSSMPEKETPIDVLATAISKLKQHPFPAKISKPLEGFIESLGPEMPFVNKMAFANASLFEPLILNIYESSNSGNALVRTTTAPTIFNSGVKENIIPLSANAKVNFRILPESTVEDVIAHVKKVIDDDRIVIKTGNFNSEPSKVSSTDSFGFTTIHKTIAEVYPEVLVSPYLVVGATDARFYGEVSDDIYRFSGIKINKNNVKSFHGLNERVAVKDYHDAIRFYSQLIKNSTGE